MRYAFLLVAIATSASAQAPRIPLLPGDSVKVWASVPELDGVRGSVGSVTADTIVFGLRSAASREMLATPVGVRSLLRVQVRDGRKSSRTRTVIGAVSGGILGLGAGGYLTWRMTPLFCNTTPCGTKVNTMAEGFLWSFVVGFGALSGGAAGSSVGIHLGRRPVDGWRQVYP